MKVGRHHRASGIGPDDAPPHQVQADAEVGRVLQRAFQARRGLGAEPPHNGDPGVEEQPEQGKGAQQPQPARAARSILPLTKRVISPVISRARRLPSLLVAMISRCGLRGSRGSSPDSRLSVTSRVAGASADWWVTVVRKTAFAGQPEGDGLLARLACAVLAEPA